MPDGIVRMSQDIMWRCHPTKCQSKEFLSLQLDALQAAGCGTVHEDKLSGAAVHRPGLTAALTDCGAGDVLHVWKLDRLGRSPWRS